MATSVDRTTICVALVGNPNVGKSTLFNALCGLRQRVGNYPGVTVEKKLGTAELGDCPCTVIDLPGTYSLAPHSPDEMVAVNVLLGRQDSQDSPNAIVAVVDASNLQRNLYLVSQLLELERPVVLALNMTDLAENRGITIDVERLESQLKIPVVPLQANRKQGVDRLRSHLAEAIQAQYAEQLPQHECFPAALVAEVDALQEQLASQHLPRYLIERLLLDTSGYLQNELLLAGDSAIGDQLAAARARLAEQGHPVPAVEAVARYDWVSQMLDGVVTAPSQRVVTLSDRVDRVLTHRVWGTLVFMLLMLLVFRSVFSWAEPGMMLIETGTDYVSSLVDARLADGAFKSLLLDGVIAGVGGVLVFLPQIFILFLLIGVLEDCGYMARAAYLMDKLMVRVGLSGKSFIPLLSSFACAIPGIMAARVIEKRRDRLTTILVAPLMSCSARLPVYTLLIAAFIPDHMLVGGLLSLQGAVMFSMYLLGILVAVVVALVLKKTLLRGETPPFVMELPSYKIPSLRNVAWRMCERGWAFVRRAGTIIFAVSVVVWAAAYYPHDPAQVDAGIWQRLDEIDATLKDSPSDLAQVAALNEERAALANRVDGIYLRTSYLGRAGRAIEPVVEPLGWDWRIGCAAIASFPAREVVVGTLGVLYNLGDQDEESTALREKLTAATHDATGQKVFNIPVALSLMVFFALCAQCAATLAIMKRETGAWRWPLFTFTYMTTLAYVAAWATYQIGMRLLG